MGNNPSLERQGVGQEALKARKLGKLGRSIGIPGKDLPQLFRPLRGAATS
jgi:hypothetical protein